MKEDIFPDAQQILDLYKNISKFLEFAFKEDEYKYKT
jgi:hypothetical protein